MTKPKTTPIFLTYKVCKVRSLNLSEFVARKHWPKLANLLAIAEPIMCKKARLLDADAFLWTPT